MAEEPTLPHLPVPAVSWDAQAQSFSGRATNKRARDKDNAPLLFSNSSDPAFFSSDDDPALENYLHGKRKKQKNVGSWFSQRPAGQEPLAKPKRTLERHLDSGVWLGSDGTDGFDSEESADFLVPPRPAPSKIPELQPRQPKGLQRVESLRISSAELAARQKIQECIEDGTEDVDLSNLALDSLSNATIEPLTEFSCIPLVTEGVDFEQKAPSLRLYLGNNQLTQLPGTLFSLDSLTVLSLRGNRLRRLPSCIGKLHNLRTLNISLNALNYLPVELLDLVNGPALEDILLDPNPFFTQKLREGYYSCALIAGYSENVDVIENISGPQGDKLRDKGMQATIQARTEVQLQDSLGRICSDYQLPSQSDTATQITSKLIWLQMLEQKEAGPIDAPTTKVVSLVELALRQCYSSAELSEITDLVSDDVPPKIAETLRRAVDQRDRGGLSCSECACVMVTPRAQWLEFWTLWKSTTEGRRAFRIPFLRQACSSMCALAWERSPQGQFAGEGLILEAFHNGNLPSIGHLEMGGIDSP